MGRKGNWFSSVKKAFSPESKKAKKKLAGKEKSSVPDSSASETITVSHPLPPPEEEKLIEEELEQTKHTYSAAHTTNVAAEPSIGAAQAAAEVVQVTAVARSTGKLKEKLAAIKIQTAFRGYLARRASRAMRGIVRLKSLVEGRPIKRQTANALKCMQTLARVQSQIQSRRIRMSEENQALQKQLLQKRANELANLRMGEEWDDSLQSKEQIEASLLGKFEAAMRRERALAYSFSHQQTLKKSTRSAPLMFMDPSNPQWGWSWLDRWMAARPWEIPSSTEKELDNDQSSTKSASLNQSGGEITKAYARYQLGSDKPSPTATKKPTRPSSHRSPSTASPKGAPSMLTRKLKPATPRGSAFSPDDEAKSMLSVQSERSRRHSIAGSSVRDDESLGSSLSVPSYMAPTQSAKAKLRMQSSLGLENGTPDKEPAEPAKKRLSFSASPRRHSGPPKVDTSAVIAEHTATNGSESAAT